MIKLEKEIIVAGKSISSCLHCPHRTTDGGGPGTVMVCGHPIFDWHIKVNPNNSPYDAAIIDNREMCEGFPDLCPLFNGGEVRS
jgi:hypothetical protein